MSRVAVPRSRAVRRVEEATGNLLLGLPVHVLEAGANRCSSSRTNSHAECRRGCLHKGSVVGVLTGEALESWVAESCRAQGVPLKVTDPRTVAKVLTLLNGRPDRSGPARPGRTDGRSKAPDQAHPFGVEASGAGSAGPNDGMVEDRVNDGALLVEIEACPLST